jgi:hypothetical protein
MLERGRRGRKKNSLKGEWKEGGEGEVHVRIMALKKGRGRKTN